MQIALQSICQMCVCEIKNLKAKMPHKQGQVKSLSESALLIFAIDESCL